MKFMYKQMIHFLVVWFVLGEEDFGPELNKTSPATENPPASEEFFYECISSTGEPIRSGESCDDGNPRTLRDTCINGTCSQCRLLNQHNVCVEECMTPYVKDVRSDFSRCVVPRDDCSVGCIECENTTLTCLRCQAPLVLELNHSCMEKCEVGDPMIIFSPRLSWECVGEKVLPGSETNSTVETVITSKPLTTVTTSNLIRTTSNSASNNEEDDGLQSITVIVIIVFAVSLGILILLCCVVYLRDRGLYKHSQSADLPQVYYNQESPTRPRQAVTRETILISPILDDEPKGNENTAKPQKVEPKIEVLEGAMALEFFNGLERLRKHRRAFAVLLQEMERRRNLKDSEQLKQKYNQIIRDLTRVLVLLKQKKLERVAPSDGMQLLAWASRMIDQFSK
eukprot:m.42241 g.42241  ORF g.42241 m.42241 type:complete len:396 (-) comp9860_c0_seq3:104-1291(-)